MKLIKYFIFIAVIFIAACGTITQSNLLSKDNDIDVLFKDLNNMIYVSENQISPETMKLSVDIINSGDFNVDDGAIYFTDSHIGSGGIDGEVLHTFSIDPVYQDKNKVLHPSILNDENIGEYSYEFRNLLLGQETELNFNARTVYDVTLNDIFIDSVCIKESNSKECKDKEAYIGSKIKNNRAPLMIDKIEKTINLGEEGIANMNFDFHFTKLDRKSSIVNDISGSIEPDGGIVYFTAEIENNELECSGLNYFGNEFRWDNSKTEGLLRCNVEIPVNEYSYSALNIDISYFYESIKSSSVKFIRRE